MKLLTRSALAISVTLCGLAMPLRAADERPQSVLRAHAPDYLRTVREYADAMIDHGRDTYGSVKSPAFAATLDRKTMKLPEGKAAERIEHILRSNWGIRAGDRTVAGANPMHDQNLYQVLYALTKATGDERYAKQADEALRWFFENCRSSTTGLLAWGEHMGWDFRLEGPIRDTHEFARPWVLWDRCFPLAPEACKRYARGLWEHQIGNQKTGNFSRHASFRRHGPGTNSQYPRHGGFYILTWSHAYKNTQDPVFAKAIETVLNHFETRRNPNTGAIPSESASRSREKNVWPESNLSLAIDLWTGSTMVPGELSKKMRACARKTDEVYLKLAHDLGPGGRGFVSGANADTLEPYATGPWTGTRTWETAYGKYTDAQDAMMCLCRWRQVEDDGYKRLFTAAADRYVTNDPDFDAVVWPGAMGDAVMLLTEVYRETGEKRYLDRAERLAARSVATFFPDGSPLPKASSLHDHYEAITRGDTLVMALLNLWAAKTRPDLDLGLTWSER